MIPLGTELSHRYRLVRFIARGGMGEVYEAHDQALNKRIALKTLTSCNNQEEQLQQLRLEVENAHRVTHKYVCRTFDLGLHRHDSGTQTPFITMELILGRSLSERIRAEGSIAPSEACRIALAILEGLEAAHDAGVLHRDLKSDNVMLRDDRSEETCPVLMDFGLSKSLTANSTSANDGQTLAGTLAYMAPEQLQGKKPRVATDLYAFGTVLFEMLAGRLPFIASTPALQALRRLQEPAPNVREFNSEVSAELALFVARCLDQDPSGRPRSAGEARTLLTRVSELQLGSSETARRFTPVPRLSLEGATPASPTIRIPTPGGRGAISGAELGLNVEQGGSSLNEVESSLGDAGRRALETNTRSEGDDTTGPPTIFDAPPQAPNRFARDFTVPGGITRTSPPAVHSRRRKAAGFAALIAIGGAVALTNQVTSHPSRADTPEQTTYSAGTFPGTSTSVPSAAPTLSATPSQTQGATADAIPSAAPPEGGTRGAAASTPRAHGVAPPATVGTVHLVARVPVTRRSGNAPSLPAHATSEFPALPELATSAASAGQPAQPTTASSISAGRSCPRGMLCPKSDAVPPKPEEGSPAKNVGTPRPLRVAD